jgi:hypothetical protein
MKPLFTAVKDIIDRFFTKPVTTTPNPAPKAYKPRRILRVKCEQCGDEFETTTKRSKYCSGSCRTLAYNARHEDTPQQRTLDAK